MRYKIKHEEDMREKWDVIPARGILPDEIKIRMWTNIQKATIYRRKRTYKWIAAACILFLLSIVGYRSFNNDLFLPKAKMVAAKTFPNDIRLLHLPDGSRVWINQNTEIEYPEQFANNVRDVRLKGEAFFEVAKNPSKPFIITSGEISTTVVGTSFNIKAYDYIHPEVHVRSGKVKVQGTQNTVFLERGYAAVFTDDSRIIKKQKIAILEPEWKKVLIDIDGLMLVQVMEKLQGLHPITVKYASDELKLLKIKGTLDTRQGFDEMLQTIAFALEVEITPTGDNTYVVSRQ